VWRIPSDRLNERIHSFGQAPAGPTGEGWETRPHASSGPTDEGRRVFSLGILVANSNRLVAQIPEIISFPQINAGSRGFLVYIPYYQGLSRYPIPDSYRVSGIGTGYYHIVPTGQT